jgi:malonyl-CoA O-methyltransferase
MEIKQGIRRNFARRAATYDCHAGVQRFMARQLLVQTEPVVLQASCILEVGCGTGYLTSELRRINPEAQLVGLDLDAGLLVRARQRLGPDPRVVWVVADGEALPGKALDLIISNSTFQWFIHPETTMSAYFNSLGPGGWLAFSTLGPGTFSELAASMRQAGNALNLPRVPEIPATHFLKHGAWAHLLAQAGFQHVQIIQKALSIKFSAVTDFLKSLQSTGATNPQPRPFSPRLFNILTAIYKTQFGQNGSIPVTYDVIWALARK